MGNSKSKSKKKEGIVSKIKEEEKKVEEEITGDKQPTPFESIWKMLGKPELEGLHQNLPYWCKLAAISNKMYPELSKESNFKLFDRNNDANKLLYKKMQYCMRYCSYSYYMTEEQDPQNLDIIDKKLPIVSEKYDPGFFIGIDEANKIILICIRGTEGTGDYGTDLKMKPDKVKIGEGIEGRVHIGIYEAALAIVEYMEQSDKVKAVINEYRNGDKYKDFEINVTGHSLGAGCASLLGLIWRYSPLQTIMKDLPLKVYSFASPVIVSENIRKLCTNDDKLQIVSVANSTDIVTRIGSAAWDQMTYRCDKIIAKAKEEMIYNLLDEAMKNDGNDDDAKQNEEHEQFWGELKNAPIDEEDLLYPVGKILWFIPKKAMNENIAERNRFMIDFIVKQNTLSQEFKVGLDVLKQLLLQKDGDNKLWNEDMFDLYEGNDAECALIFQQDVMLWPESFLDHMQVRYLACMGITVDVAKNMKQTISCI